MKNIFGFLIAALLMVPVGAEAVPKPFVGAPLTVYVGPNGSNSNSCLNAARPCATPQAAINLIPKGMLAAVTVNLMANVDGGDATYYATGSTDPNAGTMTISGFYPDVTKSTAGLTVSCATKVIIPSSPVTSTGGSAAADTLTNSGATWTAHAGQNKLLQVLSGTGAGSTYAVIDNTSTQITFNGDSASNPLDTTSVVQVIGPAAHISDALSSAPSVAVALAPVLVSNSSGVTIKNCDIIPNSFYGGIVTQGPGAMLTYVNNTVEPVNAAPAFTFGLPNAAPSTAFVHRNVMVMPASATGVLMDYTVNGFIRGNTIIGGSSSVGVSVTSTIQTDLVLNYLAGVTTGILSQGSGNTVTFGFNSFTNATVAVNPTQSGDVFTSNGTNTQASGTGFGQLGYGSVLRTNSTDTSSATNFCSVDNAGTWTSKSTLEAATNKVIFTAATGSLLLEQ